MNQYVAMQHDERQDPQEKPHLFRKLALRRRGQVRDLSEGAARVAA